MSTIEVEAYYFVCPKHGKVMKVLTDGKFPPPIAVSFITPVPMVRNQQPKTKAVVLCPTCLRGSVRKSTILAGIIVKETVEAFECPMCHENKNADLAAHYGTEFVCNECFVHLATAECTICGGTGKSTISRGNCSECSGVGFTTRPLPPAPGGFKEMPTAEALESDHACHQMGVGPEDIVEEDVEKKE